MARAWRLHLNVGIKVAAMVIGFEATMLAAYTILTQILVDQTRFLELINLKQQQLIIILLISSLTFAGYLTYLVITRIFRPVAQITRITEEFINGNLDSRLEIHTHDELEVLAERFNVMATAIKQDRELLEQKVRERTRQFEESQRKELAEQKDIIRLRDEFLFVAAHELRTPVTAIRWSLESIDAEKVAKEDREPLADAKTGAHSLAALVDDLLNMARLDSSRIEFKKELVDLRAVSKAVIGELSPIAKPRHIVLALEAPEGKPLDAVADERRVREVLTNLIGNALKFNHHDGHVWVRIDASGDKIRLDVADDGPGIKAEDQKHVFEKFWRAPAQSGIEGSGLGLFITKRLVDGMNGTITCLSEVGQGATFSVILPAEPHTTLK